MLSQAANESILFSIKTQFAWASLSWISNVDRLSVAAVIEKENILFRMKMKLKRNSVTTTQTRPIRTRSSSRLVYQLSTISIDLYIFSLRQPRYHISQAFSLSKESRIFSRFYLPSYQQQKIYHKMFQPIKEVVNSFIILTRSSDRVLAQILRR